MGSKVLISPEQYLATYYEREPEYVRGELRERPLPDAVHACIQTKLVVLLSRLEPADIPAISVRCRIAQDIYRIPDVSLFSKSGSFELLPTVPPLLVIEVISEDERYGDLMEKLQDYETWGVPRIWVVNPWSRQLAVWKGGLLQTVEALTLSEFQFEVRMEQLLKDLPVNYS